MLKEVFLYWLKGADMVVLDVPLLFESGFNKLVGTTVVVYCSELLQLRRLMQRDGLSEEAAQQRIRAQLSLREKVDRADIVLDNSSDITQLELQVASLVKKLKPSTVTWLLEYAGPPAILAAFVAAIRHYAPPIIAYLSSQLLQSLK
ncbi:hypothetical protein EC973_005542 [Apophysomyces ossiformis]|uniref:Dephospho-CoA kinase n=1 Tax=Apophysomyces ossiformis TaxID=679940 RepID=A0A8H7EM04_9FUNG|nr:hypothetical protein EC973_005542 [Apophysomyces ossiformis]